MNFKNKVIATEYVKKNFIHKDEILKLFVIAPNFENITPETTIEYIKILIKENERLENIEDKKFIKKVFTKVKYYYIIYT